MLRLPAENSLGAVGSKTGCCSRPEGMLFSCRLTSLSVQRSVACNPTDYPLQSGALLFADHQGCAGFT
jgi:hypothetical protein